MTRELMTPARRAEHATALLDARAAGVREDSILELEGIMQPGSYTPVAIASASTIANGASAPDVVITLTGDEFESGIAVGDLEVSVGTTALTLDSVTRDSATQITVGFTGTAAQGTLSIKVKASGLVTTPYCITNAVVITVPAP
jgi:hypothetical protein